MEAPIKHQVDTSLSPYQKKVITSSAAGFGLENMDVMFLSFALSSIITTLHVSGTQAGLIASVTNLGMLVGGVLFGLLADRYGRVKVFSQTIFIFAIATAAMYFANNIWTVYLCRFIAGIGAGGEYGCGIALIAESFPQKRVGKMTSVAAIGGQIGAILAAILAALILPHFGWHGLFLCGVLPVILIFFVRRHLKESPAFTALQKDKSQHQKATISALFKTPQLAWQTIALTIMVMVQIAGYFGLMNWLPSIMQQRLGISAASSSLWMIATIIGMSLGMFTFGTIMDKFGARRAFAIFLIISAVAVFAITLATNQWTLLLAEVLIGFFSNGMYGGYGAVISRLYPVEIRATANNTIMNVGRAVGGFSSMVIGFLMDRYDLIVVMAFLSLLYVLSLGTLMTIRNLREG